MSGRGSFLPSPQALKVSLVHAVNKQEQLLETIWDLSDLDRDGRLSWAWRQFTAVFAVVVKEL